MRITIAIDSFKGSLTSAQAGEAARRGIERVYPQAQVRVFPIADGGEGTVEALIGGGRGIKCEVCVQDPLGRPVMAEYGILPDHRLAVLEMATASGITLLKREECNPRKTSTFGVGQMIADAIGQGCRSFLVGIGGSATNDGGAGMLQALGFDLLDEEGKPICPGAEGLSHLKSIGTEHVLPHLCECTFHVACDVENPLCGERGCSAVFGPQKGADLEDIRRMDAWLSHFADLTEKICPQADRNLPGSGAAGGLGFALVSYLGASLESGIGLVLRELGIEEEIAASDLVLTGEGRLDGQTAMGKAPVGIAALAKKYKKPVLAFSGAVTREAKNCHEAGIDAFFPIVRGVSSLEEAMDKRSAAENMADTVEEVFRLIHVAQRLL